MGAKEKGGRSRKPISGNKKYLIAVPVLVFFGVAAALLITGSPASTNNPFCQNLIDQAKDYNGTKIYDPYCKAEVIPRSDLPPSVFRELSPMPSDFTPTNALFLNGRLPDFCNKLGPEYWSQPEFVRSFRTSGIAVMQSLANGKPVAEIGYGAYPTEYTMEASRGQTAMACTYWMTGWGVVRYQIGSFTASFNQDKQLQFSAFSDGSKNSSGITNASRYFNVNFDTGNVNDSGVMITGRTYGYFDPNWIQKLTIIIQVAPDAPKGKYFITVNPAPLTQDAYNKLIWEYKTYAHFIGTGFDQIPEQGFLTMGVEVV